MKIENTSTTKETDATVGQKQAPTVISEYKRKVVQDLDAAGKQPAAIARVAGLSEEQVREVLG